MTQSVSDRSFSSARKTFESPERIEMKLAADLSEAKLTAASLIEMSPMVSITRLEVLPVVKLASLTSLRMDRLETFLLSMAWDGIVHSWCFFNICFKVFSPVQTFLPD